MKKASTADTTDLLNAWIDGDKSTGDQVFERLYPDLRRMAADHCRREWRPKRLGTTSLIHETFLRLTNQKTAWKNRDDFFSTAKEVMNRVLIDYARGQRRTKRRGPELPITAASPIPEKRSSEQSAVRWLLRDLRSHEPKLAEVADLRFFGGLTRQEICRHLGISGHQARRLWERCRSWLRENFGRTGGRP